MVRGVTVANSPGFNYAKSAETLNFCQRALFAARGDGGPLTMVSDGVGPKRLRFLQLHFNLILAPNNLDTLTR